MDISVDEFLSVLKKSSLPTILVEGVDDIVVYRYFEDRLSRWGVSIMPVGGRDAVLEVFRRRGEIPSATIAFVVDRDAYVHCGIPEDLEAREIVFTDGYSVENDVYRDGCLSRLLRDSERSSFENDLVKFLRWYALALSRNLAGGADSISKHPDQVFEQYDSLVALRDQESYPETLFGELRDNHERLLRGKSLMPLLVRWTNYKGRVPRHNSHALLEMVAARPGRLLEQLFERVVAALGIEVEVAPATIVGDRSGG